MSAVPSDHVFHDRALSPPGPVSVQRDVHDHAQLTSVLNETLEQLSPGPTGAVPGRPQVHAAMQRLFDFLLQQKQQLPVEFWQETVIRCRRHPVCDLIHQDPFTFRAFSKPRGYAGDAVMMDFIYGREECWESPPATPLGKLIFDFTTGAPASEGVRARRGFMADALDQLAQRKQRPSVLSVAAGHLREAGLSSAVRRRRFERFVALDADERSLAEVQASYSQFGIETVTARITKLLAGKLQLGQFDLIYSLGLLDYLAAPIARRLTNNLFSMLRPGGRLVIANFLPDIRDAGYMEAFMDWWLVFRSRQGMIDMTMDLAQQDLDSIVLHAEENQNVLLLEILKAGR